MYAFARQLTKSLSGNHCYSHKRKGSLCKQGQLMCCRDCLMLDLLLLKAAQVLCLMLQPHGVSARVIFVEMVNAGMNDYMQASCLIMTSSAT